MPLYIRCLDYCNALLDSPQFYHSNICRTGQQSLSTLLANQITPHIISSKCTGYQSRNGFILEVFVLVCKCLNNTIPSYLTSNLDFYTHVTTSDNHQIQSGLFNTKHTHIICYQLLPHHFPLQHLSYGTNYTHLKMYSEFWGFHCSISGDARILRMR